MSNTDCGTSIATGAATVLNWGSGSTMTRGLFCTEPKRGYCGDCRGKGFDLSKGRRHARKCQRCRGEGSVRVGSTKR